ISAESRPVERPGVPTIQGLETATNTSALTEPPYVSARLFLLNRLPNPVLDGRRRIARGEQRRPLEPVRTRNEHSEPGPERVGCKPRLVWHRRVSTAGNNGSLDGLSPSARDAFHIEDYDGHVNRLRPDRPEDPRT